MAVLGAQLVLTLIMVSVIQKLNPHFSFAKWILCSTGLFRFLHPSDDELRSKGGVPKEKPYKSGGHNTKGGKYHSNDNDKNTLHQFHVPRSIEVELETAPITQIDVIHLRYFTEYQWLVDFSIYAAIVYIFSEIYHFYFPLKDEINLSMVWCLLVIFFSIKLLLGLTLLYFQSDESIGERSMVIVACFVYLLLAMIALIIDEKNLETGLENAYTSFNHSASAFLNEQGLSSSGPASKIVVKFFLAFSCGILGSLFTFPGLRMAKMHWDSLKYCKGSRLMQIILNLSFLLPLLLVILWIRPISRDYLTVRIFEGMKKPLLTANTFETCRLLLVVLVVIMRFALMPIYLQSYLNIAYDRIVDLRKEAGRITNVEYQKKISSIFYYLCVVTLQFAAPLIFCLYLTLMYKNLGGYTWTGLFNGDNSLNECPAENINPMEIGKLNDNEFDEYNDSDAQNDFNILDSAQNLHSSITGLKNVFSTEVYKGFLGFAAWWSYFTLFASSSLGILYQSYFTST